MSSEHDSRLVEGHRRRNGEHDESSDDKVLAQRGKGQCLSTTGLTLLVEVGGRGMWYGDGCQNLDGAGRLNWSSCVLIVRPGSPVLNGFVLRLLRTELGVALTF